jgi:hypothetical protein
MIEKLQVLSKRIYWLKPLVLLAGAGFLGLFIYTLFGGNDISKDVYLMPSILGVIWALLFSSFTTIFPHAPSKPDKNEKFFRKIIIWLKRGFYYALALLFIALTIAVIFLSFKMFGVWRSDY